MVLQKIERKKERKNPPTIQLSNFIEFFINNCMLLEAFKLIKSNSSFIFIFYQEIGIENSLILKYRTYD